MHLNGSDLCGQFGTVGIRDDIEDKDSEDSKKYGEIQKQEINVNLNMKKCIFHLNMNFAARLTQRVQRGRDLLVTSHVNDYKHVVNETADVKCKTEACL